MPPPPMPPVAIGTLPPQPPGPPWQSAPSPWPGYLATAYVGFVGLVSSGVAGLVQLGAWFFEQVGLAQDTATPSWPIVNVVSAVIVLLFAIPILFFPSRWQGLRAAGRAWIAGALLLGLLGSLRALPIVLHELYLGALTLVAAGIAAAIWLVRRGRVGPALDPAPSRAGELLTGTPGDAVGPASEAAPAVRPDRGLVGAGAAVRPDRGAVWLGAAAGLATLLPWVWLAALGGVLETVLAALAAATVGALAGTVLGRGYWAAYHMRERWRLVLGGGYVAGVLLALLAAGIGGSGVQLLALLTLPPLGYAAAALQRDTAPPSGIPVGVMVGVAAFGPLAFVDPEEFSILVDDTLRWLPLAGLVALGIALAAGLALALLRRPARAGLAALVAVVVGIAGIGVYAAAGQPGLYGDKIFVVLASQADLSDVDKGGDRTARIGEVYRRLTEHADRTQAPLRKELDRYGLDYTPYYLVNGIAVDAGPAVREWLDDRDDVDRILLDPVLRPIPSPAAPYPASQPNAPRRPRWNLDMVGAPKVWSELDATGDGIVVGSSDSGVDGAHPALRGGFRGGEDSWYDPWNHSRTPTDLGGHGTHTVGSAVGDENVGVAPGAQWIGCVNLARNMASPSRYLDCMQFMLAPFGRDADPFRDGDPARAPHVLNNSWGCPDLEGCDAESLGPAISALRAAGIFFVASAGNTGPRCGSLVDPPARYADAFSVGAVDELRKVTDFSSRGGDGVPGPDVSAPGAEILSAVPGGGYASLDGTSMAGPHVAGVVALLWSAVPELVGDIEATEKLLTDTARPVDGTDPCGTTEASGAGIVDAYAAIRAARGATA
ncbi:MAG: S8 family serine peptidase [Micromonosporaceae bacterium]